MSEPSGAGAGAERPGLEPGRLTRARRSRPRGPWLVALVLFALYCAGAGLPAHPGSDLRAGEAHVLVSSDSIAHDGGPELTREYSRQSWRSFYDGRLYPDSLAIDGRLIEPYGLGFAALVAGPDAIGGRIAVELWLALLTASGFAAATLLARRLVPDPWASGAVLAVGASPPAVLAATTIAPAGVCAALIAWAAVAALRVRDDPRGRPAALSAAALALVPWLSLAAVPAAAVVGASLVRWLRRRRRSWAGIAALELIGLSLVFYVTVNGRLFGGLTPYAAALAPDAPTGAGGLGDLAGRVSRLPRLLFGPSTGVLLFAPVLVLALASLQLLWRSRSERLGRAFPAEIDIEVAATLFGAIAGAVLLTALFAAPTLAGRGPGELLVVALPVLAALSAWSLRRVPRTGAVLALAGLALTAWILVAGHLSGDAGVSPLTGPLPWSLF